MSPLAPVRSAQRIQALCLAVVVAAALFHSVEAAQGALWGGGVMALHLGLLRWGGQWAYARRDSAGLSAVAALWALKMLGIMVLVSVIIRTVDPHPLGLFAGLSTFIVALTVAALTQRPQSPKAPHGAQEI